MNGDNIKKWMRWSRNDTLCEIRNKIERMRKDGVPDDEIVDAVHEYALTEQRKVLQEIEDDVQERALKKWNKRAKQ